MSTLQILIQPIPFANQSLLPLPKPMFLKLNLLGKPLPQTLLLLLELGIIQLPRSGFSELPRLHLLSTIRFIMHLLGRVDEVEHVRADQDRTELLEIAVVFVFDLGDAPGVLAALDDAAITGFDVFFRPDDGEWHGGHEAAGMLSGGFVVLFDRGLVDFDALRFDDGADLDMI